jgi:selenide,water dikinase
VGGLHVKTHPDLLVGIGAPDDAGVFKISENIALIQTLDFLTPVTDSPYDFGMIAAANSLSDVYAMGGVPVTAMNIVCFSVDELPEDVLKETLAGGLEKIHEAGAVLVGGHSVDDKEFKYGL